ncbi:fibroblast growth factor receptor 2-like [Dendronephthya gigantea]|uniref:fibroblast growth factor receptor 2-like n=1 Tax=Dendronephthya gigantea TaxID=151771 RepID=UPI00106C9222|nr:fibroblast growth factor receptor 2-like [Dendronephthya gigantea]XP_028414937.1 fibroblast growth factor receptor 2-like [Dendronephthya gigantea]XP_028414938.1 fibroblast growth factor receptor 2-like [Dendronephthya gigantea]
MVYQRLVNDWRVLLVLATSASLALAIVGQKPRLVDTATASFVAEVGKIVRLKCDFYTWEKEWTMTWYKDGAIIPVKRKSRFRSRTGEACMLRIKNVRKEDVGTYRCLAQNKYGTASKLMNLTVSGVSKPRGIHGKGPPWFIKPMPPRQFIAWPASNDLKLRCAADGEPPLKYQWLKDGKVLTYRRLDPKFNGTKWYLRIKTAVPSDNGLYTCIVSNRLGNLSHDYKLSVIEKGPIRPVLSTHFPVNKTVRVGDNVTFQCIELFSPMLTDYRWLHWKKLPPSYPELDLAKIPSTNSSYYTLINPRHYKAFDVEKNNGKYGGRVYINNVTKDDEGMYTCLITNHVGQGSRNAFLRVIGRDEVFSTRDTRKGIPIPRRQTSDTISRNSIIAIIMLVVVIILIAVCVIVGFLFYKKKMSKRIEGKVLYSRGLETSKESSGGVFDMGRQDSIKFFGMKRNGRLESNSSTNSTLPLMFSRQNSFRTRLPSNGLSKVDSDLCEGEFEMPYDEEWEIDEGQLVIKDEPLGEGAFGVVMKAEAYDLPGYPKCHTVAVKMLKSDATEIELADLVSEMETMKRIGCHKNIINLIGCCTQNGACFPYMVVEYAPYGNLREFLRSRRPSVINRKSSGESEHNNLPPVTIRDFISFAFQISRGMGHLVSKKCIHRDLAARNILVGEDYVMKIADFGLARHTRDMDYYRKTTDGRLPVKWLAIEALFDRVYTIQSDVWAFGVLLWEIFTLGGSPYPGIPVEKLFELLKSGYRMEKPQNCPLQIYEMMLKTWSENPSYRPCFSQLEQELEKMLSSLTSQEYLDILAESMTNITESISSDSGCSVVENNSQSSSSCKDATV